jgi:hemolysin activation/secretion protein
MLPELRQQERERALREQLEHDERRRPKAAEPPALGRLPADEVPCHRLDTITLHGQDSEDFQWLLSHIDGENGDDSPIGRCLGAQGINTVLARMGRALVSRGWGATQVLAPVSGIQNGILPLKLLPGRAVALRFAEKGSEPTSLRNAIPIDPCALIRLEDVEQGVENLNRVPTAEANIRFKPFEGEGAKPGDSEILVDYKQARHLRATLSLDDSGTKATGRHQAGATVSFDNPLGLNDLLYVSANHSVDARHFLGNDKRGTESQVLHYSVPYRYWLLGMTASNSRYRQTVPGYDTDYVYSGKSSNAEVRLSRVIHRAKQRKTALGLRGFRSESRSFIEDTELDSQRRVVGGWELGLNHREFIGDATLEGNLAYRRGTGAFGAIPAPEEAHGEGTSRFRIVTADLALNQPFKLGGERLRYTALWRAQWSRTPLSPLDRFSIGGRYTVRGFDGEIPLLGERGWLVRNDLGWALGASGAELYAGIDHGQVGGPSTQFTLGRRLTGGVIGLRGTWKSLTYDVFAGSPIRKPEGFATAHVTGGFNLNWSF